MQHLWANGSVSSSNTHNRFSLIWHLFIASLNFPFCRCWLSVEKGTIFAFVVPVLVIILVSSTTKGVSECLMWVFWRHLLSTKSSMIYWDNTLTTIASYSGCVPKKKEQPDGIHCLRTCNSCKVHVDNSTWIISRGSLQCSVHTDMATCWLCISKVESTTTRDKW